MKNICASIFLTIFLVSCNDSNIIEVECSRDDGIDSPFFVKKDTGYVEFLYRQFDEKYKNNGGIISAERSYTIPYSEMVTEYVMYNSKNKTLTFTVAEIPIRSDHPYLDGPNTINSTWLCK